MNSIAININEQLAKHRLESLDYMKSVKLIFDIRLLLTLFMFFQIANNQCFSQTSTPAVDDSIKARKDLIDWLIKISKWDTKHQPRNEEKKVYFSLMPLSGTQDGLTISSVNASFYLGDEKETYLSNVGFYPTTNLSTYFKFKVMPFLWLEGNNWNIPGKLEWSYTEQLTHGLGANTSMDSTLAIRYNLSRVYLNLNRKIFPGFYLGLGYNFDNFYNIKLNSKVEDSMTAVYGLDEEEGAKTLSSGLVFNVLFDNRKNPINPLSGLYSSLSYRVNGAYIGSQYNWQSVYFDNRKYFRVGDARHRTLALWGLYWGTWGDVPYLNYPATKLDYSEWTGRGYMRGRYRGEHMLYAEAEYRFDFSQSGFWGGVIFANAQSFLEPESRQFEYIRPAAGTGLRLKFNKQSDSNLTFDVAWGKDSFNWYMSLNEVF